MPKDYAKKSATKTAKATKGKKAKPEKKRPRWLLPIAAIMIVAFVAGLVLLQLNHKQQGQSYGAPIVDHTEQYTTPLPETQAAAEQAQNQQAAAKPSQQVKKPSFEFYQELSKDNSRPATAQSNNPPQPNKPSLPKTTEQAKQPLPKTTTKPTIASDNYVIQLGSFPKYEDADNLKAKLLLIGYQPNIQQSKIGKKTWYRVVLGPYNNKSFALNLSKQLNNQGFHTFIKHQQS